MVIINGCRFPALYGKLFLGTLHPLQISYLLKYKDTHKVYVF